MNASTLKKIVKELHAVLASRRFGKIFQLSRNELTIDFRLAESRYLYLNFSPADPRIYLITRRLRDLDRSSGNPSPFLLMLRKRVANGEIVNVQMHSGERVLHLTITAEDELGTVETYDLIVQLTGRSANLFLADSNNIILDRARDTIGDGQQIGDKYSPPERVQSTGEKETAADTAVLKYSDRPSEVLDAFYTEQSAEKKFQELVRAATSKISAEKKKHEKLIAKLDADLAAHGDAERWKRFGDLLLANASTAKREGNTILVTDFFDDDAPQVSIEADENLSITEAAEKYYRKYTKARNAADEIASRKEKSASELLKLAKRSEDIERAVNDRDSSYLEECVSGKKAVPTTKPRGKSVDTSSAARSFTSSDGFEILVGKKAKDNDVLTFKIAKSLDTWMHAADYPGSHVVIRNPNRKEIPQQTLLEAAQLAAFYSQGKTQIKAAVHYTLKKFVNKPKGAAPGLVSLASFKTVLVVPEFPKLPE